jgi:hypothetical protein
MQRIQCLVRVYLRTAKVRVPVPRSTLPSDFKREVHLPIVRGPFPTQSEHATEFARANALPFWSILANLSFGDQCLGPYLRSGPEPAALTTSKPKRGR